MKFLTLLVAVLIVSFVSASSADEARPQVLEVKGSGTCFHVSSTGDEIGLLNGWACDRDDPNQLMHIEPVADGWVQLRHPPSGLCVEVPKASTQNHVATSLGPCEQKDHQVWRQDMKTDGWFMLVAKHSGKCLDLEHGIKSNGTTVLHWRCHPPSRWQYANQLFRPY